MTGSSFGSPPKRLIRPLRAAISSACSCAAFAAAAVKITSAPCPSVSLSTSSTGSASAAQTAASGCTTAAASSRARFSSTSTTRAAPRERASRTCRQPIGPAPTTTTVSPGPDAGQLLSVQDAGERLGHRRLGEADAVGDPVEATDREHLRRHRHVRGEPALVLVAHRLLVGADRRPAPAALPAGPVRDGGDDLDPVAGRPTGHSGADLVDLAGDLVAEHPGRAQVGVPVAEDLDVGAAGRAVPDPEPDLPGPGDRLRHLLHPEVAGGVEAGRSHSSSSSGRGRSSSTTSSGLPASRSAWARSGSSRMVASWASTSTCPSPVAAIPIATVTSPAPPQSTGSANRTKHSASRRISDLPASVPCGMATCSPTYVETDSSRASMDSTYAGSTAPDSTSTAPARRMASVRSAARSDSRTDAGCSRPETVSSDIEGGFV